MTKLAYLDCPTGIAGDMCLGALVDAGVPLEYLQQQLKGLGIEREYQLSIESVHRNGQLATKFQVDLLGDEHLHHEEHHTHHRGRHLPEIENLILKANLPPRAEAWSLAVFRQLAIAEGAVHGIAPEKVYFHEVGAVDAIVDIVGTCLGLDWLGVDKIYCSALPTGGGTIKAAHGQMAVPVPAVLKLWEMRNCPVYSNGIQTELVTPTGAAIATTLATDFGSPPAMKIQRIGQGAGSVNLPLPNLLRLWLGVDADGCTSLQESNASPFVETIAVLETQIDDLNPQAIGYVLEALLAAGALDVFTQSIGMKKSRPGILLTVICYPDKMAACEAIVFRETTTLGIRHHTQQRLALQREIQSVTIKFGTVRVKVAWTGTAAERHITNVQPEYEDCLQIAQQHDLSWREVQRLALQAWYDKNSKFGKKG
jgi:hypothetical protein